ncbi:MAG: glutathione S-transferase family protein [Proteobacteria bacterium]|nr:glutathione S-transferase family protein [Pseudomonadota bacterium]
MKLYNSNLSPFASRCRMQMYAKGMSVETVDPPEEKEEFGKTTPILKIPVLVIDDQIIPESEVICEFLEDAHPSPPLRPEGPSDRAKVRLLSRIADLYVLAPLHPLFGQMDPKSRDQAIIDAGLADIKKGLGLLEHYIETGSYATGNRLSLADCALVPMLFFMANILPFLGESAPLGSCPKLAAYWEAIQKDEHAAKIVGEMTEALMKRAGG